MKYLALLTLVSAAAATHSLLATVGEDADIADRPDPKRDDTRSEKDALKANAMRPDAKYHDEPCLIPFHGQQNCTICSTTTRWMCWGYNIELGEVFPVCSPRTGRNCYAEMHKLHLTNRLGWIKKRQKDAKVWYKLGTEGGGNGISAKECYEAAVDLDPNFLYAWYYLGLLGGGNGMSEKECYERAVKLGPNDPKNTWAWNKLGTVGGGNDKSEEECYVMALRLNPSNADARDNLDRIRMQMMAQTLWYPPEAMNPNLAPQFPYPYVFFAPEHLQATMHFPTIPFQAGHMPFFSPQQMPIRESRRSKKSGADRLATHSSTRERSQSLRRSLSRERKEQIKNLEEFGNCCAFCARPNPDTTEHLLPLSRGGDNSRWNLVPACRRCNEMKGDKDVWEWYRCDNFQVESFFTEERAKKLRQFQESQKAEAEMSSSLPITRDSGHSTKKAEQRTVKFSQ